MVDLGIAQECLGNILYEVFREMGGLVTNPTPTLASLMLLLQDAANTLDAPCPFFQAYFWHAPTGWEATTQSEGG